MPCLNFHAYATTATEMKREIETSLDAMGYIYSTYMRSREIRGCKDVQERAEGIKLYTGKTW